MSQLIFDPHIHLIAYQQGQYEWLKQDAPPFWPQKKQLRRDFTSQDLALTQGLTLAGACHIEAGFDNQHPESELQLLAKQHFNGVAISYADIALPPPLFTEQLNGLKHPYLRGIRLIAEGEQNQEGSTSLYTHNATENLKTLAEQQLIFEAQIYLINPKAVARIIALCRAIPQLKVVINHAGFATPSNFLLWQSALAEIAQQPNIWLKCSGWEMTAPSLKNDDKHSWQRKVITSAINSLGAARVMLASNFPLCLFAGSYQQLWQNYYALGLPNFDLIAYQNARNLYGFSPQK